LEEPAALQPIKQEELEQVIRTGQTLEAEARWSDVLAHYETALRTYRNDTALMDRYRTARFHCDVSRRFHDSSYLNLIRTLSVVETLNFFEEVMTKIQQNYAESPQWEQLFRHGIQSYSIALTDANFRTKAQLNVSDERVNAYLSGMQTTINGWLIRNKEDLNNGLYHIADEGKKQIGLNPAVAIMEFTCGMVNSLDPYTAYLTPNQWNDQLTIISGNLVGLGVDLRSDRDSLLIMRVIQGTPAQAGGLKEGDRILAVDGVSTNNRETPPTCCKGQKERRLNFPFSRQD
jgi:carboxyl-terminal processing protease